MGCPGSGKLSSAGATMATGCCHPSPDAVSSVPWATSKASLGPWRQTSVVGVTAPASWCALRLSQASQDTSPFFLSSTCPWQSHEVLSSPLRLPHCGKSSGNHASQHLPFKAQFKTSCYTSATLQSFPTLETAHNGPKSASSNKTGSVTRP